jgi:predicted O-linked N-acetylglucosamine transferase (SPINDLY family)
VSESAEDAELLQRWRMLSAAFARRGQAAEAGAALRRVLSLAPNDAACRFQLALEAERRGEAAAAIRSYGRGLASSPGSAEATERLAALWHAAGDGRRALALLLSARALIGDNARIEGELVRVAMAVGEHPLARAAGRRHLALDPSAPYAQIGVGQAAFLRGDRAAAVPVLRRLAHLAPERADMQFLAGRNLFLLGENELGVRLMQRAVELDFDNPRFHEHVFYFHMLNQADWPARRDYTERMRRLVQTAAAEDSERFLVNPVLFLFLAVDSAMLYQAARHYARHRFTAAAAPRAARGPARPTIRLGYLSSKLRDHHIGLAQLPIVAAHDRDAVEVFLYSAAADDHVQTQLAEAATAFRRLDRLDPDAFVRVIAGDRLDVLVDLDGYLAGDDGMFSLNIMSRRPAPVQMLHHCYIGPTGTDFVDYVIGDSVVFAPGMDAFYSEKLVRLPPSYYPAAPLTMAEPDTQRASWDLPEHGFVFANFGGFYKIEPAAFASWMRILAALPEAVLWLNHYDPVGVRNLRRAAEAAGIDGNRLVFTPPPADKARHLARLPLADLFLDTFAYTSGVTSLDALWAGLPVLTLAGQTLAARVGASLNAGIGMDELTAASPAEFEATALRLARSPAALAAVRKRLRANRDTHPLFDSGALARNLERAYAEAWRRYRAGAPPQPITVAAG